MFHLSLRRKIVGIAIGLIVLMVITSTVSSIYGYRVAHLLDEFTGKYVNAYAGITRANVRAVERALTVRRMIIAKMEVPPDENQYAALLRIYEQKGREVGEEVVQARKMIGSIIEDNPIPGFS